MKQTNQIKILNLVIKPRLFFKELYEDNDYKKHVRFLTYISVLFIIIWFIRIFYLIFSPNYFNNEVAIYAELFKVIDFRTLGKFLIFLILDIIAIFLFSFAIALLAKLISQFFKIKLKFSQFWKIVCYILVFIIPLIFLQFLLDILLIPQFYLIVSAVISLYNFALLILGIKVFSNESVK